MRYDFNTPVDRRGTGSLKWDVGAGELPMWVADMDFRTAPEILDAIKKRAEHGVFGYSVVPDEWYFAVCGWWARRHSFAIEKDSLMFCTGVVPAVSSAVRSLTAPGEKVLIQTPVYNIFFNSIVNNGRQVLESPLKYDGESYSADFDELESKLSDPLTSMMLLCNPHNPVGKIWDRETLGRIGELCRRYHVTVVSDEIHCDLTEPGLGYIPFASVSEDCRVNSVTCMAPSKTFNLAGLQSSAVMVPEARLRQRINRALNTDEIAEPNAFAVTAAVAAYTRGDAWLDGLREYISENKRAAANFLAKELPEIKAVPSEATYLMWLDCSGLGIGSVELADGIRAQTGLYLSSGAQYGGNGRGFLRMNVACPRTRLYDGLERLKAYMITRRK